jgi:hypothetical protein
MRGVLIKQTVLNNEACQRLVKIPGIGPVTATAVIAAIGNGAAFRKGREFEAWMGVVHESILLAESKDYWVSVNVGTDICENCLYNVRVLSCSRRPSRLLVSKRGWKSLHRVPITTWRAWR